MKQYIRGLAAGLLLALPALPQVGGFGGPSVLTRGTRPAGREGARPVYIRGSVDLSGIYATGLTAVATDAEGNLLDEGSYGGAVGWNLAANRQGRRDNIFFGYAGNYQAFNQATYFSGLNQELRLSYARQLSRRWNMYLSQSGQNYNTLLSGVSAASTDEFVAELPSPQQEIFDNRFYSLSSAAGLNYQKNSRLSFSMSGGAMFMRRHSKALASSNGFLANGGMTYMMNRRQQIGVTYSYGTYYLTNDFGEAEVQSANFIFGRVLSRRWFLNLSAGSYQADSIRLQRVAVDPFIALLTGQTETLEVFDGRRRGFSARAAISARFRQASINMGYSRGVTPGNGVYFLAELEDVSFGAGYESRRRFSVLGQADWLRFKAVTQNLGNATGYGASLTSSYRLTNVLHLRGNLQVRRWDISNTFFDRDRFLASVGLSFSPGEVPLSLW